MPTGASVLVSDIAPFAFVYPRQIGQTGEMGGTLKIGGLNSTATRAPDYTMRSEFWQPPEEFNGCFTTFYQLELAVAGGGRIHDYLQPEWGTLRFFAGAAPIASLGDSAVSDARFVAAGPTSLPSSFEAGTANMWGIGLLPLGWSRLMGVHASELANIATNGETHPSFQKFAPLCNVLCDLSLSKDEQFASLTDFMRKIMQPNRDESKIMRIHKALLDSSLTSVAEFASEVEMSPRNLERICARYFGFPPKLLMRRQRFMRSLTSFMLHAGGNWTEAMDDHYHDQAHFSREFREFMTMNPTEYASLDHPFMASFMKARARIWGSAAQTLDTPER